MKKSKVPPVYDSTLVTFEDKSSPGKLGQPDQAAFFACCSFWNHNTSPPVLLAALTSVDLVLVLLRVQTP